MIEISSSDEEKARWKIEGGKEPLGPDALPLSEAQHEANKLRAKTGQSPRNPGYIHPTDRDKILDPRYRQDVKDQIWHEEGSSSPYARAEDRFVYEHGGKEGWAIKATAEDYKKALAEIEELEALADKDISLANKALRGILKAGRAAGHGLEFIVLGAGVPNITAIAREDLSYQFFKERMKTAKDQLNDLEKQAKEFEPRQKRKE